MLQCGQNGCFDEHSTPFVGICETYDDGGISVNRSHTFNHLAVITDAKHTAALWRSISNIFQSIFVEPVCARNKLICNLHG